MRRFHGIAGIFLLAVTCGAARAGVLASSTFDVNPAPADSRLTLNGDGTLTAHYNTLLDTDKVLFSLGTHLSSGNSFTINTRFKILSTNFFADPNGFAQIGFGLVNSTTTLSDRSTSPTTNGDTYDMVGVDYFPNISGFFASPSVSPTIFTSKTASEPAISDDLYTVFGAESALNNAGESPLPLDAFLNAVLSYDGTTRVATLSLATDGGPLFVNAGGGADANTATIQLSLPAGVNFDVDSYAITMWKDSWAFGDPSVRADVVFDSFSVVAVPEPGSLLLLACGALLLARRRRA